MWTDLQPFPYIRNHCRMMDPWTDGADCRWHCLRSQYIHFRSHDEQASHEIACVVSDGLSFRLVANLPDIVYSAVQLPSAKDAAPTPLWPCKPRAVVGC